MNYNKSNEKLVFHTNSFQIPARFGEFPVLSPLEKQVIFKE